MIQIHFTGIYIDLLLMLSSCIPYLNWFITTIEGYVISKLKLIKSYMYAVKIYTYVFFYTPESILFLFCLSVILIAVVSSLVLVFLILLVIIFTCVRR